MTDKIFTINFGDYSFKQITLLENTSLDALTPDVLIDFQHHMTKAIEEAFKLPDYVFLGMDMSTKPDQTIITEIVVEELIVEDPAAEEAKSEFKPWPYVQDES